MKCAFFLLSAFSLFLVGITPLVAQNSINTVKALNAPLGDEIPRGLDSFERNRANGRPDHEKPQFHQDEDQPHILVGAYYNTEDDFTSKLMLHNKGINPIEIFPTIYGDDGAGFDVPPIIVPANSHQLVELSEWVNLAGDGFQKGNLRLFHIGKNLEIGSQIQITNESTSIGFEYKLAEIDDFDSRKLETVRWSPSNDAETSLVLTNTSENLLTVTAMLTKKPSVASNPQTIRLTPHETKVLNIEDDFDQGADFANHKILGISLTHAGAEDQLLAWTLVQDEVVGYSNSMAFTNPDMAQSKEYHGAGLHLGKLENDKLSLVVVVRNTSDVDVEVRVAVPYTQESGHRKTVELKPIALKPKEIHEVNTMRIDRLQDVKFAGIEINHSGEKGSVIASVQSVSQSGTQVFKTLLLDSEFQWSASGIYPFLIEGTAHSKAYIKNVRGDRTEKYLAFIRWEDGGMYMVGVRELGPSETVEFDFKKLRDEEIPDENGRLLPLELSKGQFTWMSMRNELLQSDVTLRVPLVGQMQHVDTEKGIHFSYFCQICCDNGAGSVVTISPATETMNIGESQPCQAYDLRTDCYGNPYLYNATNWAQWTSTDPSVATVTNSTSNKGLVSTFSTGSTQIIASVSVIEYIAGSSGGGCFFRTCGGGSCLYNQTNYTAWSNITVNPPPIISLVEANKGVVGDELDINIFGEYFANGAVINSMPGITVSNVIVIDAAEIRAKFKIAHDAAGGNRSVSITQGGAQSNSKNFFVQIPTKAKRIGLQNTVVVDPGPGDIKDFFNRVVVQNVCGAYRNAHYQLTDQNDDDIVTNSPNVRVFEVLSNFQASDPNITKGFAVDTLTTQGRFIDMLAAFSPLPCVPPFTYSVDQKFKVEAGDSSKTTYNLTTEHNLSMVGSGSGSWTLNFTIVTL